MRSLLFLTSLSYRITKRFASLRIMPSSSSVLLVKHRGEVHNYIWVSGIISSSLSKGSMTSSLGMLGEAVISSSGLCPGWGCPAGWIPAGGRAWHGARSAPARIGSVPLSCCRSGARQLAVPAFRPQCLSARLPAFRWHWPSRRLAAVCPAGCHSDRSVPYQTRSWSGACAAGW